MSTLRFIELSHMKTFNVVLYPSGFGGCFLTNSFNILESGYLLETLPPHFIAETLKPVRGYAEDDLSPVYTLGRKFMRGVHLNPNLTNVERFFWDVELAIARVVMPTAPFPYDFFIDQKPLARHQTLYVAQHGAETNTRYESEEILDAVTKFANENFVNIRYVVMTVEQRHLSWAHRRYETQTHNIPFSIWNGLYEQYVDYTKHENAVEFNFSTLLDGDIDAFLAEMKRLAVTEVHNEDIVRERATQWYENKALGRV